MNIKCGGTDVPVPDSLDLGVGVKIAEELPVVYPVGDRRAAFLKLFPDAESPKRIVPVDGHQVFVLDPRRNTKFVHLAKYNKTGDHFESDNGWFERDEVELWAYVPNIAEEAQRRIGTEAS
jgi:hypothetical protein